jgi:hypothetical protein
VSEEIAEVKSVPEEEPTSVEVGFDICGTDPEPEFNPSLRFEKFTSLI